MCEQPPLRMDSEGDSPGRMDSRKNGIDDGTVNETPNVFIPLQLSGDKSQFQFPANTATLTGTLGDN